jgi:site-specific DNA recombinase
VNASNHQRQRNGVRALIYARQSQHREESISITLQNESGARYCRERGYRVVRKIADPGVSGLKLERRPGIQEALKMIEGGEADVLVVYRWSRLSRKRTHQAVILDRIESVGGRVECATEPVDTLTAGGRFSREILLAMYAFESDQKSEAWREAQAYRVGNGLPSGGAPPLGYRQNGSKGPFVPDEVYGPLIAEAFDLYLRGFGPQKIAHEFNRRGLRTPKVGKRGGGPFRTSTISRALDSGFAAGYIIRHGERVKGAHEPIIDEQTWQAYLAERERRRPLPTKSRQPKWHLGGGLSVCGRCGGNLGVNAYNARSSLAMCTSYRTAPGVCAGVWISRVALETVVALWLGGKVDQWLAAAESMAHGESERAMLAKELDAARADEERIRDGLRATQRLIVRGLMSEEDYVQRKAEVDAELRETAARVADLQAQIDALDPEGDTFERLAAALGRLSTEERMVTRPVDIAIPASIDVPPEAWPVETVAENIMPPEEFNQLLRKIIRKVAVGPRTIEITPWHGEPTVLDRATATPPRKRAPQPKDPRTGRFVRGAS